MVSSELEKLLEKYDLGETTVNEERQLKRYFTEEEVPAHLASYKVMFQYFEATKQEGYTKAISVAKNSVKAKKNPLYQWIAIAAVAILMLGILVPNIMGDEPARTLADLNPKEREAYEHTREALFMLSSNFNDAASSVNTLGLMSSNFKRGTEKVIYVKEFSNSTNKLIKKKQTTPDSYRD